MPRWGTHEEKQVDPTARWFFRGVWTFFFVIFLVVLTGVALTLIVRAVT